MSSKKFFNVASIVSSDGCFDLQFRKDTRHERANSPTYYRWKAQFIVTSPKASVAILKKIQKEIKCGKIHIVGSQARYSVQKISEAAQIIVPYFKKNTLSANKRKDFSLWSKAIEIIYKNKGMHLSLWKKNDLHSLIEIQKSSVKYKQNPRSLKWLDMAKTLSKKVN